MAKGVVKVEPEPELELGRRGPGSAGPHHPPLDGSSWELLLGPGGLTCDGRGYPAFHRG